MIFEGISTRDERHRTRLQDLDFLPSQFRKTSTIMPWSDIASKEGHMQSFSSTRRDQARHTNNESKSNLHFVFTCLIPIQTVGSILCSSHLPPGPNKRQPWDFQRKDLQSVNRRLVRIRGPLHCVGIRLSRIALLFVSVFRGEGKPMRARHGKTGNMRVLNIYLTDA